MGAGSTYKAQRNRGKALLRQFLPEINYANSEIRQAGVHFILAEAAEIVGDYTTARQCYETAIKRAANLDELITNEKHEKRQLLHFDDFDKMLAEVVQYATERAQEGLRGIEMKVRLMAYLATYT